MKKKKRWNKKIVVTFFMLLVIIGIIVYQKFLLEKEILDTWNHNLSGMKERVYNFKEKYGLVAGIDELINDNTIQVQLDKQHEEEDFKELEYVSGSEEMQDTKLIDLVAAQNTDKVGTYIKDILLVNKDYTLPSTYNPGQNQEALDKFNEMKKQASKEKISLKIVSGYRSYEYQEAVYNRNLNLYGEEVASRFSAKPGQSEHQTGLAFDVNSTKWAFADTKEAKWIEENCYKYGFILRYPEEKEDITGYVYEPWHIRYVGIDIATQMQGIGQCLEEYLGVN